MFRGFTWRTSDPGPSPPPENPQARSYAISQVRFLNTAKKTRPSGLGPILD